MWSFFKAINIPKNNYNSTITVMCRAAFVSILFFLANSSSAETNLNVVASIKPVHSLVSTVMQGVGEPKLIIGGAASPHTYSLRPSDATNLAEAHVVFYVDDEMETALTGTVQTIARNATIVELSSAENLVLKEFRENIVFNVTGDQHDHENSDEHHHDEDSHRESEHVEHGHGKDDEHHHDEDSHQESEHAEHGHGKDHEHHHDEDSHQESEHAEHGHGKDDEHRHDEDAHQESEHAEHGDAHAGHDHGTIDMHIWLDPLNAIPMVNLIASTLSEVDAENADQYLNNATQFATEIKQLEAELKDKLAHSQGVPFVVVHDAYQYFESRFNLSSAGAILLNPHRPPGVRHIRHIQETISELNVNCVLAEPQFDTRIVRLVIEGTSIESGVIDPLGAFIEDGPNLYFELIRDMASVFKTCLESNSS